MARRKLDRKSDHRRAGPTRARAGRRSSDEIILPLAIEVGRIGIFETDLERKRTRISPELCSLLGLPIGTVMSYADFSRIMHEDDRARVQAEVDKAVHASDLGHWTAECRVRRADGTLRWVTITGRRIYRHTTSGLKPIRSIGTVVDITHLKESESALRESEQRLRLALEAARMGTFEVDIAATEARIDVQEARLLGLSEDTQVVSVELMRKRMPLEDLRASDAKQERMSEGEAYHHEFRFLMPDGSVRWLSGHADIRANRIFGVNFDITRRKLAEEALAQSEARLRAATSAAALGVFEWDPVVDEASWGNDRIYKIFGRTHAEGSLSRAQFVADYLHPSDRAEFDTVVEKAIRARGRFHVTCRIKRRRGGQRWLEIEAKYEKATNERPARFVGVVADITTRKRIERKAQRLSQRLFTIQEEERRSIALELHELDGSAPRRRKPCSEHREPAARPQSRPGDRHDRKFIAGGDQGAAHLQLSHASIGPAATGPVQHAGGLRRRLRRSFRLALQGANGPQARQIPTACATNDLAHRARRAGQRLSARFGLAGIDRRAGPWRPTAYRRSRRRTGHQQRAVPQSATVSRRRWHPRHPDASHSAGRKVADQRPPEGGNETACRAADGQD